MRNVFVHLSDTMRCKSRSDSKQQTVQLPVICSASKQLI